MSRHSINIVAENGQMWSKKAATGFCSVLDIKPVFISSVATFPLDKIRVFFEDSLSLWARVHRLYAISRNEKWNE
jgi:hypothetical protein